MLTKCLPAVAIVAISLVPALPVVAQDTVAAPPPINILSCEVLDHDGDPLVEPGTPTPRDVTVRITAQNRSQKTIREATVRATADGASVVFSISGRFAPGAKVTRTFGPFGNRYRSEGYGDDDVDGGCELVAVKSDDGTVWRAPAKQ